jgi:hypothetical protein
MANKKPLRYSFKEKIFLKFMQSTIKKVNICLSSIYTIEKILIENKMVEEQELINKLKEDLKLPVMKKGADTLEEMLKELEIENNFPGKEVI